MKKLILLLSLILVSFNVMAEWRYYGTSNEDDIYFYDDSSIEKNGSIVKLWVSSEFKRRDETGALSDRDKMLIDCNNQLYGFNFVTTYSEHGLKGKSIFNDYVSEKMYPIAPTSTVRKLFNIVCK